MNWWLLGAALVGMMTAAAVAGDLLPHAVRPRRHCRLPCYDYRTVNPSAPVEAATFRVVAILSEVTAAASSPSATTRVIGRSFVLKSERLLNHHCALSQVAVTVLESGRWIITGRAEQTPDGLDQDIAEASARFARNRFFITVRGYAHAPLVQDGNNDRLGRPELIRLDPCGFWVERRSVEAMRLEGCLTREEMRLLKSIDRMEVEFRYE
ncbi:MAG: hypothetical protein KY476_16840 [Planctomycetes bacterium]|nr:hypothetical protein [Planctomycetota bacterium]